MYHALFTPQCILVEFLKAPLSNPFKVIGLSVQQLHLLLCFWKQDPVWPWIKPATSLLAFLNAEFLCEHFGFFFHHLSGYQDIASQLGFAAASTSVNLDPLPSYCWVPCHQRGTLSLCLPRSSARLRVYLLLFDCWPSLTSIIASCLVW